MTRAVRSPSSSLTKSTSSSSAATASSATAKPTDQSSTPAAPPTLPAATPPMSEAAKSKLKATRHLSRQMPAMDLKARLNQGLPKSDAQPADKAPAQEKLARPALVKTKAESDIHLASIAKKYGPEVAGDYKKMTDELKAELPGLQARRDAKGFMTAEDKEKLKRLESLQTTLKTDPSSRDYFAKEIANNRSDALYKHLGPTKFCSMLADVNNNIKNGKDGKPLPTYKWTTMEKVALYGYTTQDYGAINLGMRKDKGTPQDPGLAAYAKHVTSAMKQLPDYAADKSAQTTLYRALFPPPANAEGWAKDAFNALKFTKGGTYQDSAFASHSTSSINGNWSLIVQGTKNAKDVGAYSVWPKESEVLVLPGTKFDVLNVDGTKITLKAQ